MDENLERSLRRIDSQLKHRVDSQLADVRNWWMQWNDRERVAFKAWIENLIEVQRQLPQVLPHLSIRLEFAEQVGDEDFHTITPPIRAIKQAIQCWERGEPFTPTTLGEMVN